MGKGSGVVSEIDREIFKVIHESSNPEKVAQFALSLCLDYLQNLESYRASEPSAPSESA